MSSWEDRIIKDGECWLWTGPKDRDGYGQHYLDGKVRVAHRSVYILLRGEIPENNHLHHTCKNKACVNPEHLMPVSYREHASIHRESEGYCKQGHEFTSDNTMYTSQGYRKCRECHRKHIREYMRRRRSRLDI